MTKNDWAWEGIIEELGLLEAIKREGFTTVNADQLRQWREPSLMMKMEQEQNRPRIFREHGLNVLAVSDQEFAIGKFNVFKDLPKSDIREVKIIHPPDDFETLKTVELSSEAQVIHAAFLSGMISSVFGQEMLPTVSGKTSTASFDCTASGPNGSSSQISVSGARIEIDAGFEGPDVFSLFEVKMNYLDNFNLRQLYYAYRFWSERISKDLIPVLVTHSNGVFTFFELDFTFHDDISFAEIISVRSFAFSSPFVTEKAIESALKSQKQLLSSGVPFPQADKFEKVVDLLEILNRSPRTQEEIATEFAFDARQADYYFNAAKFLGLVKGGAPLEQVKMLSDLGREIMSLPPSNRNSQLVRLILEVPVFRTTLSKHIETGNADLNMVALSSLEEVAGHYGLGASTVQRRAKTLASWCQWILDLVE